MFPAVCPASAEDSIPVTDDDCKEIAASLEAVLPAVCPASVKDSVQDIVGLGKQAPVSVEATLAAVCPAFVQDGLHLISVQHAMCTNDREPVGITSAILFECLISQLTNDQICMSVDLNAHAEDLWLWHSGQQEIFMHSLKAQINDDSQV